MFPCSKTVFVRAINVARPCPRTVSPNRLVTRFRRWKSSGTNPEETKDAAASATNTTTASSSTTETSNRVPIVQSLLAAAAGVLTVSAAAYATEEATAKSVPPFSPTGQRFDQSDFSGRFCRMLLACDPRLLIYTDEQVREYQIMLKNYQEYAPEDARKLWEARRIVESALHPDTGEVMPRPFRMSGYVPFNGPICVAMVASQSTTSLLFWSWVNQSQNALVNYYNRNASSPMTNETLMISYLAAVGSALTVAFGLATLIQKRYDPTTAKSLLRWVAFPSAVVASSLNCYIVRSPEITTGIPLLDAQGQDVLPGETSQAAAALGVTSTTASRAILQAPVYFLPPVLMAAGPLHALVKSNPTLTVPMTTFLLLTSFGLGLPSTVAIFPQMSSITVAEVEEKFQNLPNSETGKPHDVFYFNKGL